MIKRCKIIVLCFGSWYNFGDSGKTDNFVYDKERKGHKGYSVYTHSHTHVHTHNHKNKTRARTHVRGSPPPNQNMTAAAAAPGGLHQRTLVPPKCDNSYSAANERRPTICRGTHHLRTRRSTINYEFNDIKLFKSQICQKHDIVDSLSYFKMFP